MNIVYSDRHVWWNVRFWILWKQYCQLWRSAKLLDMIGRSLWLGSNWQRWLICILYRMQAVVINTESKSGCWCWQFWRCDWYFGALWNGLRHYCAYLILSVGEILKKLPLSGVGYNQALAWGTQQCISNTSCTILHANWRDTTLV